MDVMFPSCAGLDVHKWSVMACRITPDPTGQQADGVIEVKEFTTLTHDFFQIGNGCCRGDRFVERVHIWMAYGRRKPSYDLLAWPRRDNADSSDWDLYRWHCSRSRFDG